MRTGVWYRILNSMLSRAGPRFRCLSLSSVDSLQVSVLRAQFGVGYMGPIILLAIGVLRAVSFRNLQAVLFLDVDPMVAVVLLAFLLAEILEDVCIWMMSRSKKIRFPIATEWHGHSLSD